MQTRSCASLQTVLRHQFVEENHCALCRRHRGGQLLELCHARGSCRCATYVGGVLRPCLSCTNKAATATTRLLNILFPSRGEHTTCAISIASILVAESRSNVAPSLPAPHSLPGPRPSRSHSHTLPPLPPPGPLYIACGTCFPKVAHAASSRWHLDSGHTTEMKFL